jgi:voltage-gated potassium channel
VIAAGEVEIALPDRRIQLGPGQFFGEVAVLRRARRVATVTAITRVRLLVLDAHDLHSLMARSPAIAAHIRRVARERLSDELVRKAGDLTTEEIEEDKEVTAK